ncbi:hypothetical protein [Amycolatopsis minnesotensis]
MAWPRSASDVASDAWGWLKDAEHCYRNSEDGTPEQSAAITAMASAAIAGLLAKQIKD